MPVRIALSRENSNKGRLKPAWPRGYKKIRLNSAGHETLTAHKYQRVARIKGIIKAFFISSSRESLPYFSENPNKHKSAFAEFSFFPSYCIILSKIK